MTETNLIKQKFKSAIKRGTGEAYLLMQSHPEIDFSAQIIKACIKNFAYDGQCESNRGDYLFGLTGLSVRKDKIRAAILSALQMQQKDTWTLNQLFDLALLFAKQDDAEARKIIYDAFVNNTLQGFDWAGTMQILELDGIEGFKFIAEEFGKRLENDPDDCQDDSLIKAFKRTNPEIDIWAGLDAAAQQNKFIKTYLECVRETTAQRDEYLAKPKPVYKDVVEELLLGNKRFAFWLRKLSDAEVLLVAERLIIEKDKKKLEKLLPVFGRYEFPLNSVLILNLAKHGSNKNIRWQALNALQLLQSDEIRQFAMDSIAAAKKPEDYVMILRSNYKSGDHELLTRIVEQCNNPDALERLITAYKYIYQDNPTPECREPLEAIYNKHTCGICREDIVEILRAGNVLSDKIKAEARFDSNKKTRADV